MWGYTVLRGAYSYCILVHLVGHQVVYCLHNRPYHPVTKLPIIKEGSNRLHFYIYFISSHQQHKVYLHYYTINIGRSAMFISMHIVQIYYRSNSVHFDPFIIRTA